MTQSGLKGPVPVLKHGAVYFADNGRTVCVKCAGMSALFTGRDISGQKVDRVTVEDVKAWPVDEMGPLGCERKCLSLSVIANADGWPIAVTA
jgi:hypothetical protein